MILRIFFDHLFPRFVMFQLTSTNILGQLVTAYF